MAEEKTNQVHTDLTFFTNEPGQTLLDRFRTTLKDTQYFDVLVGYFRSSGFYQLYESIEPIEKVRILVGLGVDEDAYKTINQYQNQTMFDFESHHNAKKEFQKNLINEIENSKEVDERLEIGLKHFIEFLQAECANSDIDKKQGGNGKKLEIKAYPSKNIHAKVYISRYKDNISHIQYGSVITGSSNFSLNGLVANREFNVHLKDRRDIEYALDQFESLWKDSIDISEEFVDSVKNKTWLNDSITPYELYLKLIYEYLQEDINLQDKYESFLPDGFMKLDYQEQAVIQALKKLDEYNGVFLADVVGLGKTFITAQLLQQLRGRILVICPPVLQDYWKESLLEFRVPAEVESLGKLESIIRKGVNKYDYVVVDEAHRFRNEATQSYADLLDICRGKKVILVTATPLNNTIDDIFSQLKLFQAPKNSSIPGVPNLVSFFNKLKKKLDEFRPKVYKDEEGRVYRLKEEEEAYKKAIREVSNEIKDKVLKHVMVRRTRKDVVNYFKSDIKNQGIVFPEVQDPKKIVYYFKGKTETAFNSTIKLLHNFKYSRYIPLTSNMRRKQNEITDKDIIDDILSKSEICRIAIMDGDRPYIVPLNYGYYDNVLYFHSAPLGKKIDLIKINNKVCFEIEYFVEIIKGDLPCDWGAKYRSVIGYGTIEFVTDFEKKKAGLDILMRQYGKKDHNVYKDKEVEFIVILKLKIDEITGKQLGNWD